MTARLVSMTGFGSAQGDAAWGAWSVDAKSVNGRGLDVRVGTPSGFEALEPLAKSMAAARFQRGNIQVAIRIDARAAEGGIEINQPLLDQLVGVVRSCADDGQPVSSGAIAELLSIRGVLDMAGPDIRSLAARPEVAETLSTGIETALNGLDASRLREGAGLARLFDALLSEFAAALQQATLSADGQPQRLQQRLETQLAELDAADRIDRDRLAAEVALSAARADVREELDRLSAHLQEAGALLGSGAPCGRKLDFLSQEIGREANTLCSKSASLDLTRAGLALKALNDQFKEQAANVE